MIKNKLQIMKLQSERDERLSELLDEIIDLDFEGEFLMDLRSVVMHQDANRVSPSQVVKLAETHLALLEKLAQINNIDVSIATLQLQDQ